MTISHAGALGIAQFIPETAVEYGLMNPFEPIHALFAAGKLLRKLNDRFGNLGLAAAAYNAGPQRVRTGWPSGEHCPAKPAPMWSGSPAARPINGCRANCSWPEATLMPAKAPCAEVDEDVRAQARIVRVSRLMSELAAATAPAPQKQLRIASPLASRAKRDENKPDGKRVRSAISRCRHSNPKQALESSNSPTCVASGAAWRAPLAPDERTGDEAHETNCSNATVAGRIARVHLNVACLCPHSLQVNGTRSWPGAAETRFFPPHLPQVASIRVSPCLTVMAFLLHRLLDQPVGFLAHRFFRHFTPCLVSTHVGNWPRLNRL